MDIGVALAVGAVLGVVCGLVPLIYGLNKGEKGLAWGGFGACIAGGLVLGIFLAIPAAIVFTILIRKNVKDRMVQQGAYGAVPQGPESIQATGGQQWGAPGAQSGQPVAPPSQPQ
jgi:hypothetical protein